jgi:hypothetical protein
MRGEGTQTNPGQTNPGQTNPGHDKPWTRQTLDTTNPGHDKHNRSYAKSRAVYTVTKLFHILPDFLTLLHPDFSSFLQATGT